MTKATVEMNRNSLERILETGSGWKQDRWGHYTTVVGAATFRLKMQAISVRFERKGVICGKMEWLNRGSDYYKNVRLGWDEETDRTYMVIGGKRVFLQVK